MDVYRTVWIAETGRHELYRLSLAGTYRLAETRRDENPHINVFYPFSRDKVTER